MRRDLVVQVILDYGEFVETFATAYEAESYLNANIDELDVPVRAWLEDLRGNVNGRTTFTMMTPAFSACAKDRFPNGNV